MRWGFVLYKDARLNIRIDRAAGLITAQSQVKNGRCHHPHHHRYKEPAKLFVFSHLVANPDVPE